MKVTFRTILCAAAAMLAAVSCQKSAETEGPLAENNGTIDIRIGGLMGEYSQVDGTKAELVNTVRVAWKGGETVYVFDGAKCLGSLKATLEGDEDRYALLSTDETHTVNEPAEGTTKLTLVHGPSLTGAPTVSSEGAISISLADQNSAKAPFVVYATLDYSGEGSIENAVVPFKFATSVIKVNCTGLKASTAIDHASLSNVNTACKLTLSGTAAPTVAGAENGTITRTNDTYFAAGKVNAEGEAVFQIAVPELGSADARALTVKQGSNYYEDKNFTKSALNSSTSVNTVCQLISFPAGALPGEFSVGPNATDKVYFSKGNLQATYDGSKYNWDFAANQYDILGNEPGNTQTSGSVVDLFGQSTDNSNFGMANSYDQDSYNGDFKDWGKNIGDGNTWRTLSYDEWKYLISTRAVNGGTGAGKSYSLNIEYGGKMGLVLYPNNYTGSVLSGTITTIPEGVVFLPAMGPRYESFGCYWSSTHYDQSENSGDGEGLWMCFSEQEVYEYGGGYSYNCWSVRLVTNVN